jgi:rsbT co-antagonist protein RsbR
MPGNHRGTELALLIIRHRQELLDAWTGDVLRIWDPRTRERVGETVLRSETGQLLDQLVLPFEKDPGAGWDVAAHPELARLLRDISGSHARQGFRPTDTAAYLFSCKRALLEMLQREQGGEPQRLIAAREQVESVIERLVLVVFDAYVEARERIISQQSQSILELSTPVVTISDGMLLLPLVGVVDTLRARQITERLLDAIARVEARVTLIDVTGVPVLDTAVAGHLMKTIAAAEMLGTRVVVTGISPEGAQTLVKLGVNFANVTTRASLRAGVTEGLAILGRRVVAAPASAQ